MPELVGEIDNLGFSIEVGRVNLACSGFYSRIDESAQVVTFVVGSKEPGIGGSLVTIGIRPSSELGDAILQETWCATIC